MDFRSAKRLTCIVVCSLLVVAFAPAAFLQNQPKALAGGSRITGTSPLSAPEWRPASGTRSSGAVKSDSGPPEPKPSKTWYFAEGSTNGGFETWILVQNQNTVPAHAQLTYMTRKGARKGPKVTIQAQSRISLFVADTVPGEWDVSTLVKADMNVIAERTMYWGNRIGGHNSVGVNAPSTDWCLAEGCTNGGFETWILVQNPSSSPVPVQLYFLTPDGHYKGPQASVPARGRMSFNLASYIPDEWEVSTIVHADQPVIVERSVYWANRTAGHNSPGSTFEATRWNLAEGSTSGGFETWILVENPTNEEAQVQIFYLTDAGPKEGPFAVLAPFSRQSFDAADYVPDTWNVSTVVSSDKLVVAERSMYWNNRKGGHNAVGKYQGANKWYVAEGCTKGGFETWVLVQNPSNFEATIKLSFMTGSGLKPGPTAKLAAGSRKSFFVADSVPNEWQVSSIVEASEPVIVEKSIYWGGRIEGGCSPGVAAPTE